MDKDEAKFILSSFRPDGADADATEFAAALRLAAADRELGDWLAAERARDAVFAGALERVTLPDGLREEILGSLAAERGEMPEPDETDAAFFGALEGVRPPDGLRREVLVAMEQSSPRTSKWSWKWAAPMAAAAGIVLALVFTNPDEPPVGGTLPAGVVPIAHVEDAAIDTLTSPDFAFHEKGSDHETLFRFIREHGRACPAGALPEGLKGIPGLGCRNLVVDGKPGALICFLRGEDDVVHLVVFRDGDVEALEAGRDAPLVERHGEWSVARWSDKGRTFLLLGNTEPERISELF